LERTAGGRYRERAGAMPFRRLGFVANEPWGGVSTPKEQKEQKCPSEPEEMGARQSFAHPSPIRMDHIIDRLRRYQDASRASGTDAPEPLATRTASVLVPLVTASSAAASCGAKPNASRGVRSPDEVHVLLCTRSSTLSSHAGEVCLPGGKNDPGESDLEAALREADEEIGLTRRDVTAVASLPPFLSKGRVSVRPIVAAVAESFAPSASRDEVRDTFTGPLESFLSEEGYSHRDWEFLPGRTIRVHFFEREGRDVWGLTASILIETAEIAFGRRAAFIKRPPGPGGTDIQSIRIREGEDEAAAPRPSAGVKKSPRRDKRRRVSDSRL